MLVCSSLYFLAPDFPAGFGAGRPRITSFAISSPVGNFDPITPTRSPNFTLALSAGFLSSSKVVLLEYLTLTIPVFVFRSKPSAVAAATSPTVALWIFGEPSACVRGSGARAYFVCESWARRAGRRFGAGSAGGRFGFADAGAIEFANAPGVGVSGSRAAEFLPVQFGFGKAGANTLTEQIVFELGKDGE